MKRLPVNPFLLVSMAVGLVFIVSCTQHEYGWERRGLRASPGNIDALLKKAHAQIEAADSREKVLELINTFEGITDKDPFHYEASWQLGRYYVLMSDAYASGPDEKKLFLVKARQSCERALYTNPGFRERVDAGKPICEACDSLGAGQIEAMYYWYVSTVAYWKYYLNPLEKLLSAGTIKECRQFLQKMMNTDPEWGGGHPYTAYAIYYAGMPKFLGQDLEKSEQHFRKAVESGPNWLYIKYSRARFLHTARKDRKGFEEDLQWVISRDPHKADSLYPWNVHFQRNAREMLANADSYF